MSKFRQNGSIAAAWADRKRNTGLHWYVKEDWEDGKETDFGKQWEIICVILLCGKYIGSKSKRHFALIDIMTLS